MVQEPFESVDDLLWLTKLRKESFAEIPFASAWLDTSPFYRPGAELMLKSLFSMFGLHLIAYRIVQFLTFLGLIAVSRSILARLNLASEAIFPFTVFLIGSPFISPSLVWISELPHVVVLLAFGLGMSALLSDQSETRKLAACTASYVLALSMKENGLALLFFYPFLVRRHPVAATLAFGGVTIGYFVLRAIMLGGGMGLANASPVDTLAYFQNIVSQIIALWTRLTRWGEAIERVHLETVVIILSSGIIAVTAPRWSRSRGTAVLALVALAAPLMSYAYARDRHLALPAYAYGLLMMKALDTFAPKSTWVMAFAWLAWSAQAAISTRTVDRASLAVTETVYRPNLSPPSPGIAPDIWTAARTGALQPREKTGNTEL